MDMRAVIASILTFAPLVALLLLSSEPRTLAEPGTAARTNAIADSYLWVMLVEITPPGRQFPTIITKREGVFQAPDRRREVAGGTTPDGQAWSLQHIAIGPDVWIRGQGGSSSAWQPVSDAGLGPGFDAKLPYWELFEVASGVLESVEGTPEVDEFERTAALHYRLSLGDLPALLVYLDEVIAHAIPEATTLLDVLMDVPVDYWLRMEDQRPLRISLRPAANVSPSGSLSFNLRISNLDDPSIRVEVPPAN